MIPKNFRFIHQDSICLLANGSMETYTNGKQKSPLLILNPGESSAEGVTKLLDSGFYRRLFCNPKRLEALECAYTDHFRSVFIYMHGNNERAIQLYDQYEAAQGPKEKRQVMGDYYDQCISGMDIESIASNARSKIKVVHDIHHITQKLYGFFNAGLPETWSFLLHYIAGKTALCLGKGGIKPNSTESLIEASIHRKLKKLPKEFYRVLKHIGVQFIVADTLTPFTHDEHTAAFCDYARGTIGLKNSSELDALREEVIHYLDEYFKFSDRHEWQQAVEALSPETKSLIKKCNDRRNKADIFDTNQYYAEHLRKEVLADLASVDMELGDTVDKTKKEAALNSKFPEIYPLYEKFRRQVIQRDRRIEEIKEARRHESKDRDIEHAALVKEQKIQANDRRR